MSLAFGPATTAVVINPALLGVLYYWIRLVCAAGYRKPCSFVFCSVPYSILEIEYPFPIPDKLYFLTDTLFWNEALCFCLFLIIPSFLKDLFRIKPFRFYFSWQYFPGYSGLFWKNLKLVLFPWHEEKTGRTLKQNLSTTEFRFPHCKNPRKAIIINEYHQGYMSKEIYKPKSRNRDSSAG